ncbi:phosphatase PAP2 family protein [Natrinema versiforme]|uniref:Phosphoesterase PA-phosphatase-related protein n=1 Tax=Natrinema versiforme JCM 10478 TaxID=1227496 RepID=L9Y6M9_9EURY|nr:phosphatase PAP2 family protein [Natrinema versiforme]ELY68538.1 phosphoesterase PA-phosphatase-related protein [Natrinema versiforme JCM 10478]
MSRGLGWFDSFREVAPEWAVVVLGLVTQLGDVWFLGVLVGTLYWRATEDQDEIAAVAGLLLAGLALITGLKHVFALPRPERVLVELGALPETVHPLYEATATATGYGFPSGHALLTTIVYLSLAEHLSVGTRRRRYLGAAGIVTAVCFSRVGLGVHYLVDVVAGITVGLVFLLLAWGLLNRYPTHRGTLGFGLAVGLGAFAAVASDADPDAVLLLGASLGAFAGWQLAVLARALDSGRGPIRESTRLAARAVGAAVVIAALLVTTGYYWPVAVFAGSGALGLAVAVLVLLPVLYRSERGIGRWTRSPSRSQ